MHTWMDAKEYAAWWYKAERPTVSQVTMVRRRCADEYDELSAFAKKVRGKWRIDVTAAHPEDFPEGGRAEARREPLLTYDMPLGEALTVMLDALIAQRGATDVQRR